MYVVSGVFLPVCVCVCVCVCVYVCVCVCVCVCKTTFLVHGKFSTLNYVFLEMYLI